MKTRDEIAAAYVSGARDLTEYLRMNTTPAGDLADTDSPCLDDGKLRAEALLREMVVALKSQVAALQLQLPPIERFPRIRSAAEKRERDALVAHRGTKIEALTEAIGTIQDIATYVMGLSDAKVSELLAKQKAAK